MSDKSNRYAVALYFSKDTSERLYQIIVPAINEHHAFGLAYETAIKQIGTQFSLRLKVVTYVTKGGDDE